MSLSAPPALPGVTHETHTLPDGLRMHVARAGDPADPVVMLVHGWPQHWWIWRDVIGPLVDEGFHVLAPDLRGFGWSDAPEGAYEKETLAGDLLALLDVLGVDRLAGLAGHDWGGNVVQLMALRAPQRIARLAVLNMIPVWGDPAVAMPRIWRSAHVFLNASPGLGARWQRTGLLEKALLGVPKADRAVYAAPFKEPARARAMQRLYRTALVKELPAGARGAYAGQRLTMPTLVLHGRRDPVIRPALLRGFERNGDDVTVELVDAGHFVVDEQPALVAERLRGWFVA